jgi:hypothetical protein
MSISLGANVVFAHYAGHDRMEVRFVGMRDYTNRIVPHPIKLDYAPRSDSGRAVPTDISQGIIVALGFAAYGGLGLMFTYVTVWVARPIDLPTISVFAPLAGICFWRAIAAAFSISRRA